MFTNDQQLKKNLKLISKFGPRTDNAKVVQFDYHSNEKYRAQVVCYINCRYTDKYFDWYAKEWINKFSMFTDTPWAAARKSSRKTAKYIRVYKCHTEVQHTCKSRIILKVIDNELSSNKIYITIDYLYCRSVVFQKLLSVGAKQSLPTTINPTDSSKPEGKPLSSIHHMFYMYFSDSFTPTTAKMYHSLTVLVNKFENKGNVLPDQTMNPTMSDVMLFWQSWKYIGAEKLTTAEKCVNLEKIMERKKIEMGAMGVLMKTQDQEMVVLITPTMKRVLTFQELDVVIVSSTAVPRGPQATIFFVPSKMGALCFACVLHQKQTLDAFKLVFMAMKATIENDFKKSMKPRSIIVHDSNDQILAIKAVFENSKVMIAPWSLCRDLWVYMCSGKTLEAVCHTTMAAFHEIMHATDAKSAHLRFIKFTRSSKFSYLSKPLRKYIEEVWKKYRLIVWWSSVNNSLIELSVTLIQQLFIEKCDSFNIINMCDVINTLDKHFKQLMMRWVSKNHTLKMHTRFLKTLVSKLNTWTIKIMPLHKFLLINDNLKSTVSVRTDTWCCSCYFGKRALYCEHVCAIMHLTDVTVTLTDDERDLLKQIAGENIANTEYSDDNNDVKNVYPPYSDGYYLFHFPMKVTTQNVVQKAVEKESIDISKIKTLDDTKNIYEENIPLFADLDSRETKDGETLNFTNFTDQAEIGCKVDVIDICTEPILQTSIKQEPCHVKDEPMDESMEIESTDTQNVLISQEIKHKNIAIDGIKEEFMNIESTDVEETELFEYNNLQDKKHMIDATENVIKPKIEEMFFIEIDIETNKQSTQKKAISNQEKAITETDSLNVNLENNNLLVEHMSLSFAVPANNFETEYKNAVDSLSIEFNRLDECLSLSPSASKLASIKRLTNELSRASMELQDIKSELDDSTN